MKQNDRLKRVLAGCVALAMLLTMLPGFAVEAPAEAFAGSSGVQGVVTPIPIHYSIPRLSGMTVQAGGYTLDVANVRVNTARRWIYAPIPSHYFRDSGVAMFDMTEGVVEVRVTRPGVTSAVVRPSRAGITPRIEGNTVIFNIYEWGQYVVEFNGDPLTHALQLFANPPFVPSPNARQITGRYDGLLRLNSNETVALMPGSVVRGTVVAGGPPINAAGTNVVNARLEGRGIVWGNGPTPGMSDGQAFDPGFSSVRIWGADGVTIDGIAFLNPSRWAVEFRHSNNVNLHNVKIISAGNNADAITMQSTRNVTVDRSYVRSWDDVIVVKNYTNRSSYNHRYTNLVLWADLAQVMEIGYETNAANEPWFAHYSPGPFDRNAYIRNITFENIDVVNAFHNNVISIHNANRARIEDITWRNIIVDNVNLQGGSWFQNLIGFRNWGFPHWFQGYGVGRYGSAADALDADGHWSIRNVLVDGVWVMGGNRGNARWGFDDRGGRRPITGVTIRRVFWVPGSEPMWANMAGAPGGVSYTASPFEPPPRAAVSQSPAPTPTPTPTPAPTPTPTPPPIQHPPTTGVRLGSDTPAGTTGYIAANLHHWGIVPYPMGGTATQVRF
ncbi:MAG: glycosyl hydrolase family 28 protein, partial [Defluviitaleaceae bacterium]|nr:glycosyl hydrolase family 28 protein [Defluviitaleaceae bacterium]